MYKKLSLFFIAIALCLVTSCNSDNKPEDKSGKDSTEMKMDSVLSGAADAPPRPMSESDLDQLSEDKEAVDLLKKCIQARGGMDALNKVQSVKMKFLMSADGMSIPSTIYLKMPDKLLFESVVENKKVMVGFDREVGWGINPENGSIEDIPAKQQPGIKMQFLRPAEMFMIPILQLIGMNTTAEFGGKVKEDGKEAYKLIFKDKKLDETNPDVKAELTVFIDAKTMLDFKYINRATKKEEKLESIIRLQNDKKVDFLVVPFLIESIMNGQKGARYSLDFMKLNGEIDDDIFKKPAGGKETPKEKVVPPTQEQK